MSLLDDDMMALCSLVPEEVYPLPWETYKHSLLRSRLDESGLHTEVSADTLLSLVETQFRSAEQGRGPGMKAVLGEDKLNLLLELCVDVAQGEHSRIKSSKNNEPIEGTEGRGLQQAAADIVSFAVLDWPLSEDALTRLHRRVLRWWVKEMNAGRISEEQLLEILTKFKSVGVDEYPTAKTASANPQHLWHVWLFLTGQKVS